MEFPTIPPLFRQMWASILTKQEEFQVERVKKAVHPFFEKGFQFSLLTGTAFMVTGTLFSFYTTLPVIAFKVAAICLIGFYLTYNPEPKKNCVLVKHSSGQVGIQRTFSNGCFISAALQVLMPLLLTVKEKLKKVSCDSEEGRKLQSLYTFMESLGALEKSQKQTLFIDFPEAVTDILKDSLIYRKIKEVKERKETISKTEITEIENLCNKTDLLQKELPQEDASEFAEKFLGEVERCYGLIQPETFIWESFAFFSQTEIFEQAKSEARRKLSTAIETEPDFQLRLDVKSGETLQELIASYFSAVPIQRYLHKNKWLESAFKQSFLIEAPSFFLVFLKKFSYDEDEMTQKVDLPIQESSSFVLESDWLVPPQKGLRAGAVSYDLISFLVHQGSPTSGHYIAYRKVGSKWYEFDEAKVHEIQGEKLQEAQSNLYLGVYQKTIN